MNELYIALGQIARKQNQYGKLLMEDLEEEIVLDYFERINRLSLMALTIEAAIELLENPQW